jgi:NTE family protein
VKFFLKSKFFIFIIIILRIFAEETNPKIGLVLSGGGGKGFVHIGVLRVLEREQIPIDYITGSSIGSIIGFLYSMGYSVDELENLIEEIDWDKIFVENIERVDRPMEEKLFSERYITSIPMESFRPKLPKGLISGQKAYMILKKYNWEARGIKDFDNFPIPFRPIATNLATGKSVVLNHGDITRAINASMAIPSLISPVEWKNMVLTDALASKNFPVDEVKEMGADIVIGVDIGAPLLRDVRDLNFLEVLNQIQAFRGHDSTLEQRKKVDYLIEPEISSYSSTDFTKRKELIALGEEATYKIIDDLKNLSNPTRFKERKSIVKEKNLISYALINDVKVNGLHSVGDDFVSAFLPKKFPILINQYMLDNMIKSMYAIGFFERIFYEIDGDTLVFDFIEKEENYFNIGYNYQSFDGRSRTNIIFGATLNSFGVRGSKTVLDIAVSQYPKVRLTNFLYRGFGPFRKIGLISSFNYDRDTTFERNKDLTISEEIKYESNGIDIFMGSIVGRKNIYGVGFTYDMVRYNQSETSNFIFSGEEDILSMYFKSTYDSYNKVSFPTSGSFINLELRAALDFLGAKEDNAFDFYKIDYYFNKYFPFGTRTVFNLGTAYEKIAGEKKAGRYKPQIGGIVKSRDKMDFYGMDSKGVKVDEYLTFVLGLRFEIMEKLFLKFVSNTVYFNNEKDIDDSIYSGYGMSIGYDSFIGPIEVSVTNDVVNNGSEQIYKLTLGHKF